MKIKTNIFSLILTVLTLILVMSSCDSVIAEAPCDHLWIDADCKTEKHCEKCGETDGEALGHTPGAEATCTADQTCTACGETLVAKHHTPEAVKGYAATCTEDGMTDGVKCGKCSEVITPSEVIDAKGHNPGDEATCTADQTCTACGETLVAKHHTPEAVKGYAATCTEDGMTDGVKCGKCSEVITPSEVIDAKGHTPGDEETCTTDQTCTVCGDTLVAKHHTPEVVKGYAATCTEDGMTDGVKCGKCGEAITPCEVIDAKGHTPGAEATCTTDQTCTVCGDTLVAKHHIPVVVKGYAATCTSTGLSDGEKCGSCGEILTAQKTIGLRPHTEVEISAVAPTCYDSGLTAGIKCDVCQQVIKAQTAVSAAGHSFEDGVCTVCGQGYYNEGMVFELDNTESYYIVVRIGSTSDKNIVIPATYKGLPVKTIGRDFTRYNSNKASFETITIPSGINCIEADISYSGKYSPFAGCENLKKVYIESLDSWFDMQIGTWGVCNPLHYGAELYCNGELVTEVTVPERITELYNDLFDGCSSITKINFHNSMYVIGGFYNLPNLTEVKIPSCTKVIVSAFSGCSSLSVIDIPDTVYHIFATFEGTAYYNNPDNWDEGNVLYVGKHLIKAKNTITGEYTVRDDTKSISAFAFNGCRGLTKLTLNDGLVTIGNGAFASTANLQSITIPATVRYIGYNVFDYMYNNRYGLEIIFNYTGPWYQHGDLYKNLANSSYIYGTRYNTVVVYYVNNQKVTGGTPGMKDTTYSEAICH